ncbi:MAG: hypothetical protein KJO18_08680 [Acidimicrobiia bacterium]|nr:hypothetical protein [Acidimicrobiia bacterium]
MLQNLTTTVAIGFAGAAILKDIRQSTGHRLLHGEVAGLIPYDFRRPSVRRIRKRFWDPSGPLLTPQVFGVGWTVNLGAMAARVKSRPGRGAV